MNKSGLISAIADKSELTKAQSKLAVEAFIAIVEETIKSGESIGIVGFGTFKPTTKAAREGRNPSTGKPMQIAASNGVSFKVGKAFKDALN